MRLLFFFFNTFASQSNTQFEIHRHDSALCLSLMGAFRLLGLKPQEDTDPSQPLFVASLKHKKSTPFPEPQFRFPLGFQCGQHSAAVIAWFLSPGPTRQNPAFGYHATQQYQSSVAKPSVLEGSDPQKREERGVLGIGGNRRRVVGHRRSLSSAKPPRCDTLGLRVASLGHLLLWHSL